MKQPIFAPDEEWPVITVRDEKPFLSLKAVERDLGITDISGYLFGVQRSPGSLQGVSEQSSGRRTGADWMRDAGSGQLGLWYYAYRKGGEEALARFDQLSEIDTEVLTQWLTLVDDEFQPPSTGRKIFDSHGVNIEYIVTTRLAKLIMNQVGQPLMEEAHNKLMCLYDFCQPNFTRPDISLESFYWLVYDDLLKTLRNE